MLSRRKIYLLLILLALPLIVLSWLYLLKDIPSSEKTRLVIKNIHPHDEKAFTQGLVYENGFLYESTGLYGRSSLRKVETETGKIVRKLDIPDKYFAEGIAIIGNRLYQLSWKAGKGFIYDKEDLKPTGTFSYKTEGWGLTTDGKSLILSDGTSTIYYIDPEDFTVSRTLEVNYNDSPLSNLNELEFINGMIFANVWQTDYIAIIDPSGGDVKDIIDLENIIGEHLYRDNVRVPNGIAYNRDSETLYITGKLWPNMFEMRLQ